jgi:plasmid stabilization system protein ParE
MRDYNLTPEATDDLFQIQDFIAQDNPAAAAQIIEKCFEALSHLSEQPLMGYKREDLTPRDVRFWSFYSYLIVYDPHTKPISIVRILSGYRDISSMLRNQHY